MDNINEIEQYIKNYIYEFSNYLISQCHNQDKINLIKDKIENMKFYEILLFISLLDKTRFDNIIDQFIKEYDINDTNEVRYEINNVYLCNFLQIKDIINK